jgi:hypothetical protein
MSALSGIEPRPAPLSISVAVGRGRIWPRLVDFPARSRRLISQHRHNRRQRDREVSDRSRRDLTAGTGRFNLGVVGTLTGTAAAISTAAVGFIAQGFGDAVGFLTMAACTSTSIILLWALLPETKPAKYAD